MRCRRENDCCRIWSKEDDDVSREGSFIMVILIYLDARRTSLLEFWVDEQQINCMNDFDTLIYTLILYFKKA